MESIKERPQVILPQVQEDTIPPAGKLIVNVTAAKEWQDTSLNVRENDIVNIKYQEGHWTADPNQGEYDADGIKLLTKHTWIVPGAPHGGLCAKIGENGDPFYVGNRASFHAPGDGDLMLIMNDDWEGMYGGYHDNCGFVRMNIWKGEL